MHFPTPLEFIRLLQSLPHRQLQRLECIVLNACRSSSPLADMIHSEFPDLLIVSWSTLLDDAAACTFASGFYGFLGIECRRGHAGDLVDAIVSAAGEFHAKFSRFNPASTSMLTDIAGKRIFREEAGGAILPAPPGGLYQIHWPVGSSGNRMRWRYAARLVAVRANFARGSTPVLYA